MYLVTWKFSVLTILVDLEWQMYPQWPNVLMKLISGHRNFIFPENCYCTQTCIVSAHPCQWHQRGLAVDTSLGLWGVLSYASQFDWLIKHVSQSYDQMENGSFNGRLAILLVLVQELRLDDICKIQLRLTKNNHILSGNIIVTYW